MKHRKQVFALFFLPVMLFTLFSGCQSDVGQQYRTEDGLIVYPGSSWDMTPDALHWDSEAALTDYMTEKATDAFRENKEDSPAARLYWNDNATASYWTTLEPEIETKRFHIVCFKGYVQSILQTEVIS